jgi:hypothetical protein
MSGFNPREIPQYRPRKDAVKAQDLNDIVRRLKRLEKLQVQWPLILSQDGNNPILTLDDLDSEEVGLYYNDGSSGQDCPPFGVLAVTGFYTTGNLNIVKAKRPSSTFYTDYIVDAGGGCEIGKVGKYQLKQEKVILYDSSATPAFDEWYGPKPDTFESFKWYHTFKILGIEDSDLKLARALYYPIHKVRGKTSGSSVAKGTNFTLQIYNGNDVSITGWTISVNNDYIAIPASVLWAHAVLIAGQWELAGLECSS